jgi:hypothetical protein
MMKYLCGVECWVFGKSTSRKPVVRFRRHGPRRIAACRNLCLADTITGANATPVATKIIDSSTTPKLSSLILLGTGALGLDRDDAQTLSPGLSSGPCGKNTGFHLRAEAFCLRYLADRRNTLPTAAVQGTLIPYPATTTKEEFHAPWSAIRRPVRRPDSLHCRRPRR